MTDWLALNGLAAATTMPTARFGFWNQCKQSYNGQNEELSH
jgi:hypothetical protein